MEMVPDDWKAAFAYTVLGITIARELLSALRSVAEKTATKRDDQVFDWIAGVLHGAEKALGIGALRPRDAWDELRRKR